MIQKNNTIPTPEEINDMYDSYQEDLTIRDRHLKLLPVFPTEGLDDLIALLKEPYQIDLSERKNK